MTIAQMGSVVHSRDASVRIMAALKAFVDESGFDGPMFVLGGFVAGEDDWEKFDIEWRKLIERPCCYEPEIRDERKRQYVCRPLEFLHAADMEGLGKGRFKRIGQRNRTYLIQKSIRIINSSPIVGFAFGVSVNDYNKMPQRLREHFRTPYMLCMHFLFDEIAKVAKMFIGETNEDIAYIFEEHKIWELTAHKAYIDIRDVHQREFRMGTITFAPKNKFTPLQAADRLAFETFKAHSEPHINRESAVLVPRDDER